MRVACSVAWLVETMAERMVVGTAALTERRTVARRVAP